MSPSREHAPFVQHGDPPGDRSHEVHVVLDHHHRVLPGQRCQQARRALDLLRRHAGDRLVDEQQLRAPASAACRSRAIASGRARGSSPARRARSASPMMSRTVVDALALRRRDASRRASSRTTCRRPARARGSRTPSAARTRSASETSARCRPARSRAPTASSRSMSLARTRRCR